MAQFMRENGGLEVHMESVISHSLMEACSQEIGIKENTMDLEPILVSQVPNMMVNGQQANIMELDLSFGQMDHNIRANGKVVERMAKVNLSV